MTEREIRETLVDCRRAAWADPTPDWLRVPLWSACDAIRQQRMEKKALADENASLRERLARQAAVLERTELDLEQLRRATYGGQRGGAA